MKINFVNNNSLYINKQTANVNSKNIYHSNPQEQSHNVTFNGSLVNFFRKCHRPQTEQEVIKKLSNKSHGCYIKTEDGYKKLSKKEFKHRKFNFEQIIIQQPENTSVLKFRADKKKVKHREGITPQWVIQALKQKVGELIFIVNNNYNNVILHRLHLPKNETANQDALASIEQQSSKFLEHDYNQGIINPTTRHEYLYSNTKTAVDNLGRKDLTLDIEFLPSVR